MILKLYTMKEFELQKKFNWELAHDKINNTGSASQFQYEIGQYLPTEGGIIGHRWLSTLPYGSPTSGTIQNYLVIDIVDIGMTHNKWCTPPSFSAVEIPNCNSEFDGRINTNSMILAGSAAGIDPGTAAVLCTSSENGGKSDWYLPAVNEFKLIYNNKWFISQGLINASGTQIGINNVSYWTSTQASGSSMSVYVNSENGYQNNYTKWEDACAVRAFRRFTI